MRIHPFAAALVLLSTSTDAFTPLGLRRAARPGKLSMVMKEPQTEQEEATTEETPALLEALEQGASVKPHPPDTLPPQEQFLKADTEEKEEDTTDPGDSLSFQEQFDRLVDDMWDQEQVLQGLRESVRGLSDTLKQKTQELLAFEDVILEEKDLKKQLDQVEMELKDVLETEEQTEEDYQARVKDYKSTQETLEDQVGVLQKNLVQTQFDLRREQERYSSLTQRLLEVEGTAEFEEDDFQTEKKALLEELASQKAQMQELQAQYQTQEAETKQGLEALRAELDTTKETLQKQEVRLEVQRLDHQEQRAELQDAIQQKEQRVLDAKDELKQCQGGNSQALEELQNEVSAQQKEYQQLQETIAQQNVDFANVELELKDQLSETTRTLEQQNYKLQNEQTRHQWEHDFLQERLAAESKRLDLVQRQLEKETQFNNQIRADWDAHREARTKRTQSTAKNMKRRFDQLRVLLTGKTQAAKREGRQLERTLRQKYEDDVAELQLAIVELQEAVALAHESHRNLQARVDVEQTLVQEETTSQHQMEANMQLNLDKANIEILRLQKVRSGLVDTLKQQEKDIENVESSVRVILRASWRLTKDKAGNLGRRVVRKIRRR